MKVLTGDRMLLLRFLVTMASLTAVYHFWFVPRAWTLPVIGPLYGHFVHYTMMGLTESVVMVIGLFGAEAETFNLRNIDLYDSVINLHVRNYCLGVDMMAMLTFLVISYPGRWRDRLWFIPMGLFGVFAINVLRVSIMCYMTIYHGYSNFIDRHALFNILATGFIFLMFVQWVRIGRSLVRTE